MCMYATPDGNPAAWPMLLHAARGDPPSCAHGGFCGNAERLVKRSLALALKATGVFGLEHNPGPGLSQVAATLQYAHANDVTPFMEPVLELCLAVLTRERREAGGVIVLTPGAARRCRQCTGGGCRHGVSVRCSRIAPNMHCSQYLRLGFLAK